MLDARSYDSALNHSGTNYYESHMSDEDIASLVFEIRWFAVFCVKLMSRDLDTRLSAVRPGLSGPQFGVLRMLECRPCTIKELAAQMLLTPSTLVPIIDRLEKEGLVVRGKDPEDRRRTPLTLTDEAHELLAQVPIVDPHDRACQVLASLGAAKGRQLSQLLQDFVSRMADDDTLIQTILSRSPCRTLPRDGTPIAKRAGRTKSPARTK